MALKHHLKYYYHKMKNKDDNYYDLNGYHHRKAIFVHVPKTGGTSVSKAVYGSLGGGHYSYMDYRDIFGPGSLQEYFTFTFVRDPIDRFLSAINYLNSTTKSVVNMKWRDSYLKPYREDINAFIQHELINHIDNKFHLRTQTSFLLSHNGKIELNFVGRFEQIQHGFEFVKDKLKISESLSHQNHTTDRAFSFGLISRESLDILNDLYDADFKQLNYDKK